MNNYSILLIIFFYITIIYPKQGLVLRTLPREVISHDYHNSKRIYRALTLNQEWYTNLLENKNKIPTNIS